MSSAISIYTRSVTFPVGGHRRDGYLARPSTEGPYPGLVIIHESYGLNDNIRDFTTNAGRTLDATLDRYQIAHDIKIYPDAEHSFFNDQGPNYDPAASADAWQRVLAYFSDHL